MYRKILKNAVWISFAVSSSVYAEFGAFGFDDNPPASDYYEPTGSTSQRNSSSYDSSSYETSTPERSTSGKSIPAKQVIIQNRKTITVLSRRVGELEMRLEGLTSLVEGLNATIAEMKMSGNMLSPSSNTGNAANSANTALIKELGVMIDKINASYVSKEELNAALKGKKIPSKKVTSPKTTTKTEPSGESLDGKPTSKIYSEGVRLFVKKRYDEAEKRFMITDKKGYKPAASNYYLGEIAYYTKNYDDAIFYYKKSAGLYDQASYIDVLLLHTAISLEKTGDKAQAKTFYNNIVDNYPDKKSASIAKNKLKKL
jgi:TolA-binding protein